MKCNCGESDPSKFYVSRKNKCKACVSRDAKERYHNLDGHGKAMYKGRAREWQKQHIFESRYLSCRDKARQYDIEFTINIGTIKALWKSQAGKCFYSGLTMELEGTRCISIVRRDSDIGYIDGNVVLCISPLARLRGYVSESEMYEIVEGVIGVGR